MKILKPEIENKGHRLDQWLAQEQPEFSRSAWQKKIKAGEIRVNGKPPASAHQSLKGNETVEIVVKKIASRKIPETPLLHLLFENKDYAVIEKPAGWTVHAGSGTTGHLITDALANQLKGKLSTTGGKDRPGIVHRLDKDTSGILVVAKSNTAHRFLAKQFEERKIQKEYLALVEGHVTPSRGSIEAPLGRNRLNRQKIRVVQEKDSRYALTHYTVLKTFNLPVACSLIQVRIETGRTHQIRVHFEAIGHPVLGDSLYGRTATRDEEVLGLHRQFLHAERLAFTSPSTGKKVEYKSPLPADLKETLDKLK
jgi:23S rRNA pseudouridine1911/1915/1917 synthase